MSVDTAQRLIGPQDRRRLKQAIMRRIKAGGGHSGRGMIEPV